MEVIPGAKNHQNMEGKFLAENFYLQICSGGWVEGFGLKKFACSEKHGDVRKPNLKGKTSL